MKKDCVYMNKCYRHGSALELTGDNLLCNDGAWEKGLDRRRNAKLKLLEKTCQIRGTWLGHHSNRAGFGEHRFRADYKMETAGETNMSRRGSACEISGIRGALT